MNQFPIADKPSRGPTIGITIIILLIILGGVYIFSSRSGTRVPGGEPTAPPPTESPAGRTGTGGNGAGQPTGTGQITDLSDLEAETQALETDLQTLDQEAAQ